jgi:hypothetical protein
MPRLRTSSLWDFTAQIANAGLPSSLLRADGPNEIDKFTHRKDEDIAITNC